MRLKHLAGIQNFVPLNTTVSGLTSDDSSCRASCVVRNINDMKQVLLVANHRAIFHAPLTMYQTLEKRYKICLHGVKSGLQASRMDLKPSKTESFEGLAKPFKPWLKAG